MNSSNYNCHILLEKTTFNECKNPSFPSDAYIIFYNLDGNEYIDLVRGKRTNIFDMYYDTYGPDVVKKICFGYGRVNPKLWGYESKERGKK